MPWGRIGLVALAVLIGSWFALSSPFLNPGVSKVVFLIPDGFRGPFSLVEDQQNGESSHPQNGVYTLRISPGGELRLKDLGLLREWHEVSASYGSGELVPDGMNAGSDVVAFHMLDTGPDGTTWYLIGTEKERLGALSSYFGRKLGRIPSPSE